MRGMSAAELVNKQLQIIDILSGETPVERLCDRIGAVNVVYDYSDFADKDLYIEVKKEYVSRLITVLNEAQINCEIAEGIPAVEEIQRWKDFPRHSKGIKLFLKSGKSDEYAIIKTTLKSEKVYYLIADIIEYEKHNVKVEVTVVDTREVDDYADIQTENG